MATTIVTTNLIGGGVIYAFGDSKDAMISVLSGIAFSEAQIWTQPWRATSDLARGRSLGATNWQIFARVIWPAIFPAFIAGCSLSFARSLGEFGAIVFISGNLPFETEVMSLLVFIRLDEYDYPAAAAIATVMLVMAFLMLFVTNSIQAWQLRYADRS